MIQRVLSVEERGPRLMNLSESSVPNRSVRPALGTAGLTQAFSETAGPDYGRPSFQKKKVGPGLGRLLRRPIATKTATTPKS